MLPDSIYLPFQHTILYFSGDYCENQIDECLSDPCNDIGSLKCNDSINSFTCDCNPGFTGLLCEVSTSSTSYLIFVLPFLILNPFSLTQRELLD